MVQRLVSRFGSAVKSFHEDDGGMEAIQAVVILAVSAMVLVGLHTIWQEKIKTGTEDELQSMFSLDFSQAAGGGGTTP